MFQLTRKIFALFGYRLSRKKPRRNFASLSKYEGSSNNLIKELLENLYDRQSPYSAVDTRYRDEDYPHTNITTELLETLFVHVHEPRFILEFGSMLGGSAMIMAQSVKRHGCDANIVCVDPFTGDADMWAWEASRPGWKFLRLEDGIPTIYKRFLANVYCNQHNDIIFPINCTTSVGVKLLSRLREEGRITSFPNYIYLDSAHEPDETLLELRLCWSLLEDNGVLFGDDWGWEAVRNDVLTFSREITIDESALENALNLLPGSEIVDGKILLFQKQWVLFSPGLTA